MTEGVKSAVRVVELFEYFDRIQRDSSVMEIARALGIPQSSTSALLRSLVQVGYLAQDAQRRTFVPTARLTRLGSWVAPAITPDSDVIALMNELGARTGETIILGAITGDFVRYLHVVPATTAMRLHVGADTERPIVTSGIGRMLLAQLPPERVREIVQRHLASHRGEQGRVTLAGVMRDLATIRAQRYCISVNRITPGAGVIAVALPHTQAAPQLALGIGGLAASMERERDRLVRLMRQAIASHLGGARTGSGALGRAGLAA
jgi:IclR family transcriptional regulator, acetate operon repressor